MFNENSMTPIYVQLAEWLKDEILIGNLKEEERIYSQYTLAEMFNINPATGAKALNILADENLVYKKRGVGMFVSSNAVTILREKKKEETLNNLVDELLKQARVLEIKKDELFSLIEKKLGEGDL